MDISQAQLRDAIWRLPVADRTALLALSVVDSKRGAPVDAVLSLIDVAARMASLLNTDRRYRISERCRSVADRLELAPVYIDGGTS